MKVIAINGSPRKNGNTSHALNIACEYLNAKGIETEIIQIGDKNIRGCLACYECAQKQNERCAINDEVNDIIQKMKNADGILLGSPVHYAGLGGTMKCFLDRVFFVAGVNGNLFRHKVGASISAVRRSGGIEAVDQMNKYIQYSEMFSPSSSYWNVIHGLQQGEVVKDSEGVQIIRVLANNMAYLMDLIENGKGKITPPEPEGKIMTNFIR